LSLEEGRSVEVGGYEIEREIGRGGMGVVLRARALDGRVVAIKLLLHAQKAEARALFAREQRLLASLGENEGFVPLLASGDSPRGPFLVMPFLEGGTLRARLGEGPLPIEEVRALGIALARAMARAHEKGIVHRDLKPENVLFTGDGRPLVTDLGLAKHFSHDAAGSALSVSLSKTGESKGTVGYMAPEQVGGSRSAGPPADVFALGAILYECLVDRNPFDADNPHAMIARTTTGEFVPLRKERPEIPAGLARTIERSLAPLPAKRFADAGELARELERDETPGRGRLVLAVAGVALLAVAGVAAHVLIGAPAAPAPPAVVATPAPTRPRPDPGDYPPDCRGFLESRLTRLEAVSGTYVGHLGQTSEALAWSSDGKHIVAVDSDRNAWLLDAATGVPVRAPDRFNNAPTDVAFSPDARLYVAGMVQGQCRVVEVATGKVVGEWQHDNGWLQGVAFAPDGQTIASTNEGGTTEIHDVAGKLIVRLGPVAWKLPDGRQAVHTPAAVAFLPDGRLVTGGRERPEKSGYNLCLWDPGASKMPTGVFPGHTNFIRAIAVSREGLVLTAGLDSTVKVWDLKGKEPLQSFDCPGTAQSCAFSRDGKRAAAGGQNGFVEIWDASTGEVLHQLDPHDADVRGVAFSPDGKRIASSSFDGTVRVRDATSGQDVWRRAPGHGLRVRSLAVVGTERLISASEDGTCRVWNTATGREERRLIDHEPLPVHRTGPSVNGVSATPDGRSVAIGRSDGTVRFVDVASGAERRVFNPGNKANVTGLAIASDGGHALSADDKLGVALWSRDEVRSDDAVALDDGGKKAFAVALSPDGGLALSGGEGRVVLWDMATRRPELELAGHAGDVTCVAFAPDGRSALSAGADRTLRVWDVARLRRGERPEPQVLLGHDGPVQAALFFPDGERIASASQDGTIRIWQTHGGRELDRIDLASAFDQATSLAVSPDGKRLHAGTRRGVILRFEVAPAR
jgi:WD40 repeat protein